MKRYLGFVLLALLPIIGCNQPSPTPPGPTPPVTGGGQTNTTTTTTTTTTTDPTRDWYAYSATDGSYSVKFPGKPEEKSQSSNAGQAGQINYVLVSYSTNSDKRAFLSSSTMYSVDPSNFNVEKGLDGARDGAANSSKATVTNEKKIDFKGAPGREFYMSMPNGTKAKERIYIVNKGKGPVLYQTLVVDTEGNIDSPDVDQFLDSLDIKNP